jgi:hypothetical protein
MAAIWMWAMINADADEDLAAADGWLAVLYIALGVVGCLFGAALIYEALVLRKVIVTLFHASFLWSVNWSLVSVKVRGVLTVR